MMDRAEVEVDNRLEEEKLDSEALVDQEVMADGQGAE